MGNYNVLNIAKYLKVSVIQHIIISRYPLNRYTTALSFHKDPAYRSIL